MNINVAYPPQPVLTDPAEAANGYTYVCVGSILTCTSFAVPPAVYQWRDPTGNLSIGNSSTIKINFCAGTAGLQYICYASNLYGIAQRTVNIMSVSCRMSSTLAKMNATTVVRHVTLLRLISDPIEITAFVVRLARMLVMSNHVHARHTFSSMVLCTSRSNKETTVHTGFSDKSTIRNTC